ncbi:hypothetical protein VP01_5443g1, partial [Puccinia sorghi]
DYLVILKWLKIERNYNSFLGTGKAPAICRPEKDKYKKVHTKSISKGFGLNEDQKAGISKINEKLESMCPHYHVMNELIGGKAFINPWFKFYAQAENKTATSSPSEPSGNEIRSSDMESNDDYVCISTRSEYKMELTQSSFFGTTCVLQVSDLETVYTNYIPPKRLHYKIWQLEYPQSITRVHYHQDQSMIIR